MGSGTLLGRERERARLAAVLEAARRGQTGTLVIIGEPGIGKTALLQDATRLAAGMLVLRATGSEAESTLPYAGLHALLSPVLDLVPRLDRPRQNALRAALRLDDGDEPDVLAVRAGTLDLLVEAAATRPVLVVLEDVHWLDPPSADSIAFAARRLEGEEIAFLASSRTGASSAFADAFDLIELGPLSREDARVLLGRRSDPPAPSESEQLLDLAAGNPLALLELPAAVAAGALDGDAAPTDRIWKAFAARVESLTAPSRLALLLAAADPDPGAVRRAGGSLGLEDGALAAAEGAGLVRVAPEGVTFRHPLVRSLVYSSAPPAERRRVHLALADALTDEPDRDRRAWHLAAAATEPDEELAALLEKTADRAASRGGHAAAARAFERAARLSQHPDALSRRLARAARHTFWSGDIARARTLADEAFAATSDAELRADALLEHAAVQPMGGAAGDGERLVALSAELEPLDPDRTTRLLMSPVGWRLEALDVDGALELVPRLERAARLGGSWWGPRGLLTVAEAHLAAGDSAAFSAILSELDDAETAVAAFAGDLIWAERYDLARRALESTLRSGREAGNLMQVIWNQACVAQLELRLGRLSDARTAAAEAITVGEAHGVARWVCIAQSALAGVQAWQGDAEACRRTATDAIAVARESCSVVDELSARAALGLLELGLGHAEEATEELAPAAERWQESSFAEPSGVAFVPELVEAFAQCGNAVAAQACLGRFRAATARSGRRWAAAAVARCDGILAPADGFAEPFERALSILEGSPLALERARTHLAYGERLRRAGRRRAARSQLRAAHEAFARVDAVPWAERAAAELRATGETVGPRSPDREAQLTPQELQIAHLVAAGKTNKEIAARLYLSPKTIESHLGKAYRKLDIHSRAELTRIVTSRSGSESS